MGNRAGRSDFEWVYTDQPHTQRRKEMLGTEDRARVLRPPAPASLVGEGALGFCVRRLPGALCAGEAGVQAGGEPPVSPTAGRCPGARVPRWMQGWLSPSHGLVSRTGSAVFGSRALSHCSLVAAGTDGGSGCTWTGDLRPALPFRAGPDPALGTLRLRSSPPASPWPKLNPALVFKSPEPASPDWAWLPASRACPVPPRGDHTEAAFWLAPGMGRGPCGPRPMAHALALARPLPWSASPLLQLEPTPSPAQM
uniref:Delta 4-desaturase, sphingolipid 2 n=1 Tax=Bos taurus TaxID=9913 RepID=A0AAA9T8M6_BOVIN